MAEIIFNAPKNVTDLESQIQNLQTTLASLNQQVIILQEAVQERDQKIRKLERKPGIGQDTKTDDTLTIAGGLIKLYKFFLSGKAA